MRLILILGIALRTHLRVFVATAIIAIATHGSVVFASQIQSPTLQQTPAPQASPSPTPQEASGWHSTIDSLEKLITALGIIVGGFWAWLKFFRGRTFRSRLELVVSAKIIMSGTNKFLKATMQVKNVGLSQVTFKKDAIYLDVFLINAAKVKAEQQLYSATWSEPVTFEVFKDHGWIESTEEISDQLLLQLPASEQFACKLKLIVNSQSSSRVIYEKEGTRWSATDVIDCLPPTKADDLPLAKKDNKDERVHTEQLES